MRISTRGPDIGICNICGKYSKLSDDHIPPKGVPLVGQSYLMELIEFIGADAPKKSKRLFKNGVKYKSICEKCNNVALGQTYDPALIEFCKSLHEQLGKRLYLPIGVEAQTGLIAKSVVGHLLAYGIEMYRKGKVLELLNDYFNSSDSQLPSPMRLYGWLYPYNDQVIIPGAAGIFNFQSQSDPMFYMLLKFYPYSFLLTQGDLPELPYSIVRLDNNLPRDIFSRVQLSVPTNPVPPRRWPELPDDNGMTMHTILSTGAIRSSP